MPSNHPGRAQASGKDGEASVGIEPPAQQAGPSVPALAVLHEIQAKLEALISSGQPASIDLCRIPLTPLQRGVLRDLLGQGEVNAQLDCLGPTEVRETAVPGVWWVIHRNQEAQVLAESIEVTDCPAILRTAAEDLQAGLDLLCSRLAQPPQVADRTEVGKRAQPHGLCSDCGCKR